MKLEKKSEHWCQKGRSSHGVSLVTINLDSNTICLQLKVEHSFLVTWYPPWLWVRERCSDFHRNSSALFRCVVFSSHHSMDDPLKSDYLVLGTCLAVLVWHSARLLYPLLQKYKSTVECLAMVWKQKTPLKHETPCKSQFIYAEYMPITTHLYKLSANCCAFCVILSFFKKYTHVKVYMDAISFSIASCQYQYNY